MAFRFATTRSGVDEPGVSRRWLRALLFEDWTLKVMALLITLGLWYAVTTQRAPATMRLRAVQLDFMLPENVEIGNQPVEEVDITLEGSHGKLAELNARNLVARADVTDLKPGDRVARLTDKNVSMDLPDGVRIVEINPRSLTLHLEPVVEREVPDVAAIERAFTETISVAGQRETLTLPQVAVDISDHKVTPLDPTVSVRVEIAEEQAERRFASVPVRSAAGRMIAPASATVTLRGPRSIVESLRPEDVRLVVEVDDNGAPAPRLSLPPSAVGRVELVSTTPSEFAINR
jgi:YbbR domain-containing protein